MDRYYQNRYILYTSVVGVVIGRRYVGPWLISVYKKARTTLLRGKGKGGSQLKR
ncbi:TPA: hypothetical protein ACIQMB_000314 [Bacillus pacificus]